MELVEDALGDGRNAVFLAIASDLAYMPEAEGKEAFKKTLGLDAQLFSQGNTQAYVATNDNHIVVAFRGTEAPTSIEGIKDWLLTDALNLLVVPGGPLGPDFAAAGVGAKFHQGFINAIYDIWEPVSQEVEAQIKKSERPLWITGHSLGGALALLAAWLFKRKFVPVHQIYTFGGPMIGNPDATKALNEAYPNKIYRYVHGLDPVPKLPTVSMVTNDYDHCMKEMGLGEAPQGSFFGSIAGQALTNVGPGMMDQIWKFIQDRIGAHSMTNYMDFLKKK